MECLFAVGSTCFVALHQGQVVGYSWVHRSVIELFGHRVARLSANGSYTTNGFVLPEYRGKKVFQCLTCAVYTRMKAEGYTFTCNLVDRGNVASITARANLGARFQETWILLLPWVGAVVLGRGFVMGVSLSEQGAAGIVPGAEARAPPTTAVRLFIKKLLER